MRGDGPGTGRRRGDRDGGPGPDLRLHVPLDERDDLNEGAVQGELFPTRPGEPRHAGYRGPVASRVAGITYRQLDYWARKQIVEPSITASHGSGSRRLYSFRDVVLLAVAKRLLDAGVNLQNVTAAVDFLASLPDSRLSDATIMCDGTQVEECTSPEQMTEILRRGRAVFAISVGSLWQRVRDALAEEGAEPLEGVPVRRGVGSPLDDLTAERMRRRLERRGVGTRARIAS